MQLTVLQENLSKALSITSRFASTKAQLPVLANVLLNTEKNKLNISATNLENSICISIGAKVETKGQITVPSRTISDLISNLQSGQLTLQAEKEKLQIQTSGFKSTVAAMNASEFPDVPSDVGAKALQLPVSDFLSALSKVLFAVSSDETRPVLTGVLVIINTDSLNIVSTDGFRLSQKNLNLKNKTGSKQQKLIIPRGVLGELTRIDGEGDLHFSFDKDNNQVIFKLGNSVLSSRIIEGEFPDFEKIIPKESKLTLDIDREELLRAVKLASVFARDAANVVKIKVGKDSLQISAASASGGKQESEIDAKVESDSKKDLLIAFNYRFLEDFLNSCEDDTVKIKLSDSNSPALFLDPKDADYLHIIMPVKI